MKVVEFRPRVDAHQSSIIEVLESALRRAKAGEFAGVAIVYVRRDGAAGNRHSENNCGPALLGALAMAQRDLIEAFHDAPEMLGSEDPTSET